MSKHNCATARLKQDYLRLKKDPVPYITAEPLPNNLLEWHYVVCGPEATTYEGGYYHGKLIFPREFPFKPPSIYMITPSDTWNPAWSVSTILTGLLSFMIEKSPTLGSIDTTDYDKVQFAFHSLEFNLRDKQFCDLFPDIVIKIQAEIAKRNELQSTAEKQNLQQTSSESSNISSFLTNMIVILSFAAFAFTVKYVMKTSTADSTD